MDAGESGTALLAVSESPVLFVRVTVVAATPFSWFSSATGDDPLLDDELIFKAGGSELAVLWLDVEPPDLRLAFDVCWRFLAPLFPVLAFLLLPLTIELVSLGLPLRSSRLPLLKKGCSKTSLIDCTRWSGSWCKSLFSKSRASSFSGTCLSAFLRLESSHSPTLATSAVLIARLPRQAYGERGTPATASYTTTPYAQMSYVVWAGMDTTQADTFFFPIGTRLFSTTIDSGG
mmetsp:Transcript_15413/g.35415  ORF Transcript_15413/g.35415 Transcript_15413/m.35415 type:complete len:232 (+) Transcript_15413:1339-2034(+)